MSLPIILCAQAPSAGQLVQIHNVSTAERNAITDAEPGMLIYDTSDENIYIFTRTHGWIKYQTAPSVYVGSFIIEKEGALSIEDLPFKPSQITFVAHANIESFNIDSDNGLGDNSRNLQNSHGNMTGFARDDNGTITQQVIYSGAHGNSVNDISRYSSNTRCIGIRFGHQNGDDLGKITAGLASFDETGFTIKAEYTNGTLTDNNANPLVLIQPDDVQKESIVVMYTAYR